MAKATTKLNPRDRVILFCTATGIDHAAVGILARAMQPMAIRGFVVHDREKQREGVFREMKRRKAYEKPSERKTRAHSLRSPPHKGEGSRSSLLLALIQIRRKMLQLKHCRGHGRFL